MINLLTEKTVPPETVNINPIKLAKAINLFENQWKAGKFPGGQIVLRRHGKLVVNEVFGIARGFRPEEGVKPVPVQRETLFPCYSVGKPIAAIAVAMLEERGILDVNAPIAEILPEFAKNGKEKITTLDVLTHRASVLMPEFNRDVSLWVDEKAVLKSIIEAKPAFPRGKLAYGPFEFGWILSEVTKRLVGKTLAQYCSAEIAGPLGLNNLKYGLAGRDFKTLAKTYWLGPKKVMLAGYNVAENFEGIFNDIRFFECENPAASLVSNAMSIAIFYDFLLRGGKSPDGKQLLSEKTIRTYTTSVKGLSWDHSNNMPQSISRGFSVGYLLPSIFGYWNTNQCFGHVGGFSSLAFGDYQNDISVAMITNGNISRKDVARFIPLSHALRQACEK